MAVHDQSDRLEVRLDVVGQLRHHMAGDGQRADRPNRERVAVGRRLGDIVHPERERAARLVLDNHRTAENGSNLGSEDARHRVGRAAGRLRHDQADRLVGIVGDRRAGQRPHDAAQQQRAQ